MAAEMSMAFLEGEQDEEPKFNPGVTVASWHPSVVPPKRGGRARVPKPPSIRTRGSVAPGATEAWVYVAKTKRGRVKVGITSDLVRRALDLQAVMVFWHSVRPDAALAVETRALVILGRCQGDGEWVPDLAEAANAAIVQAMDEMRRYMHIDPHLTEKEARLLRISLASAKFKR